MHESFGKHHTGFAPTKPGHGLVMVAPDAFAVLALVGKQSQLLLFHNSSDVHVVIRRKTLALAARVHFEEENLGAGVERSRGALCEQAGNLMIDMRVHRPMCE